MPSETPILRVSRPVAACQRCRNAKTRCDGRLPACTACERLGKADTCLSASGPFAQGRERSYVATLESRMEKLEKRISQTRAKKSSAGTADSSAVAHTTPEPKIVGNSGFRSNRAAQEKEASDIDNLAGDFGLLVVSATARDFHGFTNTVSYARLVMATSIRESLPGGPISEIPPQQEAMALVQHFLDRIFVVLPIFDEAAFYASVDAVLRQNHRRAAAFDIWCVRMVLAISSLLHSRKRWDKEYSEGVSHLRGAIEQAEQVLHPGSMQSIQAMLLLVLYSMLDPRHLDNWNLVGMTSRIMVDLGIHQDPSKFPPMPKAKLELRRRVFWCLYTLDRSTSIVQTRTFSFSDDSFKVTLPFGKSRSVMDANTSAFSGSSTWLSSFDAASHLFRLRRMQSEWYTTLFQSGRTEWADPYQYIWQTYYDLNSWWKDVAKTTSSMTKIFFELELNYSYVYILSPSPKVPVTSDYAQRLLLEHCIIYGNLFLEAVTQNSHLKSLTISFYDMMRAYMTGRQLVDILVRNRNILLRDDLPASQPLLLPTELHSNLASPPTSSQPLTLLLPPPIPGNHTSSSSSSYQPSVPKTDDTVIRRAITSINGFTTVLTTLGTRFGYLSWRDNFQKEAEPLLVKLRQSEGGQLEATATHNEALMASVAATTATSSSTDDFRARDSVNSILLSDNDRMIAANQNIAYQYPSSSDMGMSMGMSMGTNLGESVRYAPYPTNLGQQQYSSLLAGRAGANVPPVSEYGWGASYQSRNPHL